MKNKFFLRGSKILQLIVLFTLFATVTNAQRSQVIGTVKSDANESIIGASVVEKGTTHGILTDFDGNFTLEVPSNSVLVISYVGYKTQEIPVNGRTHINIILEEDVRTLDEMVVIGYGTLRKSDLTGAISSVDVDELASRATTNPAEALQGKVAGVNILKSGGNAGAGVSVKIRGITTMGSNTPLYIIDGFPGDITTVNPNDIASLEILKDGAAAAIYGSVAANGVVLVTTKNGKKGETKIDVNTYLTFNTVANQFEMLNAAEYMMIHNRMYDNAIAGGGSYTKPNYLSFLDANGNLRNPGANTNWQDVMLRNGFVQNYNVSVRGGSDFANYSISYNHADDKGVFLGNRYVQDNARTKLNIRKGILELDANTLLKLTKSEQPQYSLKEMYMISPLIPVYDEDQPSGFGLANMSFENTDLQLPSNRNVAADNHFRKSKSQYYDMGANISLRLNLTDNLKFTSAYSYSGYYSNSKSHTPSYVSDYKSPVLYPYNQNSHSYWSQQLFDNTLNYIQDFNDHSINAIIGSSIMADRMDGSWVGVEGKKTVEGVDEPAGFPDPNSPTINAGLGGTFSGGDNSGLPYEYRRASFFGRLNYSYAGKYLFQGTLRGDGSSKFGANNRWGYFPSVALGWRISEEEFFQNDFTNSLKLRFSWGRLGNEKALGYYGFEQTLTQSNTQWMSYVQGGSPWMGGSFLYLQNNDLRWETTDTKNAGVDFVFLNNRLTGALNYYYNKTEDLLIERVITPSAGVYNSVINVGKMRNKGFELELNWADRVQGFDYNVGFNLSTLNNMLLEGDPNEVLYGEGVSYGTDHFPTQTLKGYPVASFFVYKTDGIFQSDAEATGYVNKDGVKMQPNAKAGDIRFVDVDGNGIINDDDKVFSGSGMPKLEANFSFNGAYKGFDLSLLLGSAWGHKLYNANRYWYEGMNAGSNFFKTVLDSWSPENPGATMPRAVMGDRNRNTRESDRYVEKGDFVRLRQLQIGYMLPNTVTSKASIEKCRLYLSGENLFTWTAYQGIDPEFSRGSVLNTGIDNLIFPFTRTFVVGLQLTF